MACVSSVSYLQGLAGKINGPGGPRVNWGTRVPFQSGRQLCSGRPGVALSSVLSREVESLDFERVVYFLNIANKFEFVKTWTSLAEAVCGLELTSRSLPVALPSTATGERLGKGGGMATS